MAGPQDVEPAFQTTGFTILVKHPGVDLYRIRDGATVRLGLGRSVLAAGAVR